MTLFFFFFLTSFLCLIGKRKGQERRGQERKKKKNRTEKPSVLTPGKYDIALGLWREYMLIFNLFLLEGIFQESM